MIKYIGFEGMHRTGKGTQIKKVKTYLEEKGQTVYAIRGEGSRKGIGEVNGLYFDPKSQYFQDFSASKKTATIDDWRTASNRIQREILIWKTKLEKITTEKDNVVILMDRTIISRFSLEQNDRDEQIKDFAQFLSFTFGKREFSPLIPDIIFSFSTTTKTLLSRLDKSSDTENETQTNLRRKNITKGNNRYNHIIANLPQKLEKKIYCIDAGNTIEEVFGEIKKQIESIL